MKGKLKLLMFIGFTIYGLLSCGTTKDGVKYKLGELIVQLKGNGNIEQLVSDFSAQELKNKNVISERMKMYLVSYNMLKITQEKMTNDLKAHEMVQNVELNSKVEQRD